MYLEKFVEQLEALVASLLLVEREDSFNITGWFAPERNMCGYVACILGHHIIKANGVLPTGYSSEHPQYALEEADTIISSKAVDYAYTLDAMCEDLTGSSDLIKAIYSGERVSRMAYAEESGLFLSDDLEAIPHLTERDPTITEAISFIRLCIKRLGEVYG